MNFEIQRRILLKGVAYAEPDKNLIVGATKYYREHPNDVGSMIHEMVHIVQRYPGGCPGWFVEGMADFIRYFQYEPDRKPGKPGENNNYDQGYGVSAYFLNHINQTVSKGPEAIKQSHTACRNGNYRDAIWTEITGRNLDALWKDMMTNG
jgi:Peptidase of plants and bacteria